MEGDTCLPPFIPTSELLQLRDGWLVVKSFHMTLGCIQDKRRLHLLPLLGVETGEPG